MFERVRGNELLGDRQRWGSAEKVVAARQCFDRRNPSVLPRRSRFIVHRRDPFNEFGDLIVRGCEQVLVHEANQEIAVTSEGPEVVVIEARHGLTIARCYVTAKPVLAVVTRVRGTRSESSSGGCPPVLSTRSTATWGRHDDNAPVLDRSGARRR